MRFPKMIRWPRMNLRDPALGLGLLIIVVVGGMATMIYVRGNTIMKEQLRKELQQTAAVAALQFSAIELEQIRTINDVQTDTFHRIVTKLKKIQTQLPDVRFAYLMRRTDHPAQLEFIAEHDSLDTPEELDKNGNGTVESEEEASQPGDRYIITGIPAMQGPAFAAPTVDEEITVDQWGAMISGYAPIHDEAGASVAILGLDMNASNFIRQSHGVISPLALLSAIVISIVIAGMMTASSFRRRMRSLHNAERERYYTMQKMLVQMGGPVSSISWWAELLRDKRMEAKPDGDELQMLEQLSQASRRLNESVEGIRRACDIEQGIVPQDRAELPLSAILTVATSDMTGKLRQKNQRLNVNVDPDLAIETDPDLLSGVIHELLENASAFSAPETVITIRGEADRDNVSVMIEDQGRGIKKEDVANLFDFTHKNTDRYKPTGNGLGLHLSRLIIESLGGTIRCHSKVDVGSTFTITLPRT